MNTMISSDSDSSLVSVHQKDELEKEAKVKIVEAGVTDVRFFPSHCHFKQNKIHFNISNILHKNCC